MTIEETLTTLIRDGFILVFNQDKLDVVRTAEALITAGINNMEVTCRISQPLEKIRRLHEQLPGFSVGAASLVDDPGFLKIYNATRADDPLPSVDEVVSAGASYLVSAAGFCWETYKTYAGNLPMIPSCGTVSEIVSQYVMGANLVKIFPADQLGGPAFARAIDPAIHKTISLVPTGGTDASNIPDYVDAGILVLGGSFSALGKETVLKTIETQDYGILTQKLLAIKALIDGTRSKKWPSINFRQVSIDLVSRVTGRNFNIR